MSEPVYRRDQNGTMIEVTPQAQGKAAALSAYLARGGTPFKHSGRFKKGPMKGKNVDEATAEFERMWAVSPDSLKQKYANRSSGKTTDLAPSERLTASGTPAPMPSTNASLNASLPGETSAQTADRFRANRIAKAASQTVGTPSRPPAGSSFAELTKTPAIPAGGVNSVGDGQFEGGKVTGPSLAGAAPPGVRPSLAPKPPALVSPEDAAAQTAVLASIGNKSAVAPNSPSPFAAQTTSPPAQAVGASQSTPPAEIQGPPRSAAPTVGTPSRINKETGLPFGYIPGDSTNGLDQAKVAESSQRAYAAQTAATPAPPKAIIAPAAMRYADAQNQYQAGTAPADAMDKIYSSSSSLDQAKITAQSMKRAAGLQPRKPMLAVGTPSRPKFANR